MDSSISNILITNAGIAGIVVILIIFGVLVPKWYVSKLEKELELKNLALDTERSISSQTTAQLAIANQLIGELRNIALSRAAHDTDLRESTQTEYPELTAQSTHEAAMPIDPVGGSGT